MKGVFLSCFMFFSVMLSCLKLVYGWLLYEGTDDMGYM